MSRRADWVRADWIRADYSGLGRKGKRDRLAGMQNGQCAICRIGRYDVPLQADHDHDTGLLRGMLCQSCNNRESRFRRGADDPAVHAYLDHPPAAGLGWMWELPDWWTAADTGRALELGMTAAEYAAEYALYRRNEAGPADVVRGGGRRHPGMIRA